MRKTINISVSQEMHEYIYEQAGHTSVSEYIRSLVRREQQRRQDYAARPVLPATHVNNAFIFARALDQIEKLKEILEQKDSYDA